MSLLAVKANITLMGLKKLYHGDGLKFIEMNLDLCRIIILNMAFHFIMR